MKISIALIGDHNESITAHQAIPLAIGLAADALQIDTTTSVLYWHRLSTRKVGAEESDSPADNRLITSRSRDEDRHRISLIEKASIKTELIKVIIN